MFDRDAMDILMKFLDRKVLEAEKEVTEKGTLSEDKAIPLMLKMQFNHIQHLEESVNDRFGQINQRFEQVNQRFERITNDINRRFDKVDDRFAHTHKLLFGSVAFLSLLMTTLRFIH